MSGRSVGFSPDFYVDRARASHKHANRAGWGKRRVIGIWSFRLPKSSSFLPVGFLRRFGAKVAMALHFRAVRMSSRKVSSSSSLARSRSYAETVDSHRAEAIDDCIEFLKCSSSSSSSSLHRSNSVPANHC